MNHRPGITAKKKICIKEWAGLMGLGGLVVFFLATSWRKWPDPVIDFGCELYTPWRLANGAVLYRDIDCFYGPLSKYFNAVLFKCFGPGLMVLVTANLAVFVAILAVIYGLCRRAWDAGSALAAAAVFVAVFGFSQFVRMGNYNYATPYAHEATHGFLICLLLIVLLVRWLEQATRVRSFLAGGLFGLTAVLKPEIMLAAGLITLTTAIVQWRHRKQVRLSLIAAWAGGAILPTLGFIVFFAAYLPWQEAVRGSCTAWLKVAANTRSSGVLLQATFLGFDNPWKHLWEHFNATWLAGALMAVIVGAAWLAERIAQRTVRLLFGGLWVGLVLWLACFEITWSETGRCLFGLMLIYTFFSGASLLGKSTPEPIQPEQMTRLLLAVLATALMARMVLNGRIYQLGFYQAALAGLLVPAVLIGELPMRLGLGRCGRVLITAGSLALLVPGVVILAANSQRTFHFKTVAVGEGADRFYTFPSRNDPTGEMVGLLVKSLREVPPGQTLIVLPEGAMINYLARLPSPVSPFRFFFATTDDGREAGIVDELQRHPPDWIVIVSRELREYGIQRYGEGPGSGQLILRWVADRYDAKATLGGNPLDGQQYGAVIFKRNGKDHGLRDQAVAP
jgi:hypothetical protein